MIIRLTIRDSDVIPDYIKFCTDNEYWDKKPGLFPPANLSTALFSDNDPFSTQTRLRRAHYLDYPSHNWKPTDPEYQEIINEIYQQWDVYAKDNNLEDWKRPDIRIQYNVTEKDENGEVLYYFTCIDQCIVM